MRCTSPRTVGFGADGKTIVWSKKQYVKLNGVSWQLPCGKCIECRLDYARQWAVRCVHEAMVHGDNNCFVTLTYSDENLSSPKLVYRDFQLFMKKLRKLQNDPIGVFVTGEYGDKTKRPHWHALLFNYRPTDSVYFRSTPTGDRVFRSDTLTKIWGKGHVEFGSVTFESAGYCARYAAKKLVHGQDGHDFEPISKKSSKHAIGKRWLEKNWRDAFSGGEIILRTQDGQIRRSTIPRYYEKWLKDNHPDEWLRYVTNIKTKKVESAEKKSKAQNDEWWRVFDARPLSAPNPLTPAQVRRLITDGNFRLLQSYLKL